MKVQEKVVGESIAKEEALWQEDIWLAVGNLVRKGLKVLLENLLKEDVTGALEAGKYRRTRGRKGYRNGKYLRDLLCKYGLIEDLSVPRIREGEIEYRLFEKYQRRQWEVDSAFGRLFLAGVSTHKLKKLSRDLFGKEPEHPGRIYTRFLTLPGCLGIRI